MDLSFTPAEEAFRDEVRRFIAGAMPPHIRQKAEAGAQFHPSEVMEWHRILHQRGWAAPHWPKEHGGAGFDATQQFLFAEEVALAGAPNLSPFGLFMVGPLIQMFGTDAQKQRFLPKILSGDETWCQGYSEPGSGSDLASLRTSAVDKGDHFVCNGQKTWTTYAQYADWIFCLVRTSPEGAKQAGISFLLVDMKTPGVRATPMLTLGGTPAFCDTFFDDVVVPKENLLGPLNGGWTLAKALLLHERTLVGSVGPISRQLRRAWQIAAMTRVDGRPLSEDPVWRRRIVRVEMRLAAHKLANYRALAASKSGRGPGAEASILKLVASTLQQQADELCMELMGHNSIAWYADTDIAAPLELAVPPEFCYNRATTIYAGSNEIQKNIIAKLVLGLPMGAKGAA